MQFIAKKGMAILIVWVGISLLTFFLIRMTNGNPAANVLGLDGQKGSKEAIAYLEQELGLDLPVWQQYVNWLKNITRLNFGNSYFTGEPVIQEIMLRLPKTLGLSFSALIVAMVVAVPIAYFLSVSRSVLGRFVRLIIIVLASMPSFWMSLVLLYVVCVQLKWLPVVYQGGIKGMILPTVILSIQLTVGYILLLEDSISQVLHKAYILTAEVKGVQKFRLIALHMMRNALIPIITMVGYNFAKLLAGSFIVESIFNYPGIGKYAMDSILKKDYPVIQAYIVIMASIVIIINTAVEGIYYGIDPTLRRDNERVTSDFEGEQ